MACAPYLEEAAASDIAAVILKNMKAMVGMLFKDAPATPGAPEELRPMNRIYLRERLRPARCAQD